MILASLKTGNVYFKVFSSLEHRAAGNRPHGRNKSSIPTAAAAAALLTLIYWCQFNSAAAGVEDKQIFNFGCAAMRTKFGQKWLRPR